MLHKFIVGVNVGVDQLIGLFLGLSGSRVGQPPSCGFLVPGETP